MRRRRRLPPPRAAAPRMWGAGSPRPSSAATISPKPGTGNWRSCGGMCPCTTPRSWPGPARSCTWVRTPTTIPRSNDLRRASEELHRAAESSDVDIRILLARLRLRLTETQVATHRQTNSAEETWALLDECRRHVSQGSADARELDHAQARLLMAESRWKAAYERLTALAQNARDLDAQVAALHCEYILSSAAFKLAPRLQTLLQVCESRDGKPAPPGAHPHTTVHLQAALLADQGAIFENMDLGKAFASYRRALELRPRMIFVQRALLRCLAADNRLQQALESGEGLLSGAPSEGADPEAPPPVGLMVEVCRLLAERDRLEGRDAAAAHGHARGARLRLRPRGPHRNRARMDQRDARGRTAGEGLPAALRERRGGARATRRGSALEWGSRRARRDPPRGG